MCSRNGNIPVRGNGGIEEKRGDGEREQEID